MMIEPVAPAALDAEQSILALCLSIPEAAVSTSDLLQPTDMYAPQHQSILTAVSSLVNQGKTVDIVTVSEELRANGMLEQAGGVVYIASLGDLPMSLNALEEYARLIREASAKRQLAQVGRTITALATGSDDAETMLSQAEGLLAGIARTQTAEAKLAGEIASERWKEMYKHKNDHIPSGVATGFNDLDKVLCGLQQQDLIILAARPSMGKSALAAQIAEKVAENVLYPAVFFSAEMSATSLADRLVCGRAGLKSRQVRARMLKDEDWQTGITVAEELLSIPLWIDDSPNLTTTSIRAKSRRILAKYKHISLIVIDYLQLLLDKADRGASEDIRVGQMSRSCKQLAKECNCPVLLLSQLSRAVEARTNKRPILSDLRSSGAIEQDADVVMFIYRDDYYYPESKEKGIAEVIIGKHRNGPTGTIKLVWSGERVRFYPYSRREQ